MVSMEEKEIDESVSNTFTHRRAAAPVGCRQLTMVLGYPGRLRRTRSLSKALARALSASREASTWPGARLPVCRDADAAVEQATRNLQRELQRTSRR